MQHADSSREHTRVRSTGFRVRAYALQVESLKRHLAAITLNIQRVQSEVSIVSDVAAKEGLTR